MTNIMINRDGKCVKLEHANLLDLPKDERIWIQLVNPNEIEVHRIIDELNIPEDFVRSALDDEEGPRLDKDEDTQYTLMVFDIPVIQREHNSDAPYTTIPLLRKITLQLPFVYKTISNSKKLNKVRYAPTSYWIVKKLTTNSY